MAGHVKIYKKEYENLPVRFQNKITHDLEYLIKAGIPGLKKVYLFGSCARGGEFGISILVFLVDCCTANNTVAIVMAGPIAKEISDEFHISPKRSASLLDIFASVGQGVIPYGAQLLTAAGMAAISPVEIMPYLYYPILMGVSAVLFILFRSRKSGSGE